MFEKKITKKQLRFTKYELSIIQLVVEVVGKEKKKKREQEM